LKKALIIRYGAYGDSIILSPVFKQLKKEGYYVIFNTNSRGREVYDNTSFVDEFIMHKEDTPIDGLPRQWEKLKEEIKPDYFKNFTSSIETNLALHPSQPLYVYSKEERRVKCNKNYYEETERISDLKFDDYNPVIEYNNGEIEKAKGYLKDNYNLLWCLSGSGHNKAYPWTEYVMGSLIQKIPNINIITVGDEKCKLLETISLPEKNFTELAGEIPMKVSMALTSVVDLVVSPDTGILHASGATNTPKIGLLGNTSIENITKHFKNDYSIQSGCSCSPCFRLIYDHTIQCPCEFVTGASWCMYDIKPETLYQRILKAKNDNRT
jgi:ADP-heptose:LPS heptosyltransferase